MKIPITKKNLRGIILKLLILVPGTILLASLIASGGFDYLAFLLLLGIVFSVLFYLLWKNAK